jgi:hypothetical protein
VTFTDLLQIRKREREGERGKERERGGKREGERGRKRERE